MNSGLKKFELRKNDRKFAVGDFLILKETEFTGEEMASGSPLVYTGREKLVSVCHILAGPIFGLMEGWVIMSIMPVGAGARGENRAAQITAKYPRKVKVKCQWKECGKIVTRTIKSCNDTRKAVYCSDTCKKKNWYATHPHLGPYKGLEASVKQAAKVVKATSKKEKAKKNAAIFLKLLAEQNKTKEVQDGQ